MWGLALTFLGEKPSWLMALPWHYQITTRGLSGFQVHLPETPSSLPPSGGDGVAAAPGPLPTSAWMWGWWR